LHRIAASRARIAIAGDDDALLSITPALQILPPHNASHHPTSKKTNARTMRALARPSNLKIKNQNSGGT